MNIRMKRGMALALTASLLLAGSAQALFGLGKSKPETVSPENGPTARDLEIRTYRGIPYLGQLEAADPDGGELTFAIVTQPKKGTVTVEGANFTYTPKENAAGGDSFTYSAANSAGAVSLPATVTVTIEKTRSGVTYADTGEATATAAQDLAERGVFTGAKIGDKWYFEPERTVSRGEFLAMVLETAGAEVTALPLDEAGVSVEALRRSDADVVHISPSHHYPTGLVMPIARRQELLRWAQEVPARVILEDDYDSEFRFVGRPIPTLFSIDGGEQVVYLNTFSKTIAPSIRISFMVLPRRLLADFRQKLGFYACTVSAFEQYTLAQFLAGGWYEKHLSRMRKHYRQKRDAVIAAVYKSPLAPYAAITEEDAGLHFLLRLDGAPSDETLRREAEQRGIRLAMLSDYYQRPQDAPQHVLVVNYTGIDLDRLPAALERLAALWKENDHV